MNREIIETTLKFGAIAAVVACVSAASAATIFDPRLPLAKPVDTLTYEAITPYLKFADVYGDHATTGHGKFVMIKGRQATPSHIHSAAYHGIVVRGVITNGFDGDKNPPKLKPGSYWYVPANAVHVTACISKEPCMTYVYSDEKFDFIPAEPK